MGDRFGVQVVKRNKEFKLVVKTRASTLDLFDEAPAGFSPAIWATTRGQGLSEVKRWLAEEGVGHGVIVYEGTYFEYLDDDKEMKYVNWPIDVKNAYTWLKKKFNVK